MGQKGSKTVTEAQIRAIPKVEYTDTWNPGHHWDVITAVTDALSRYNVEIYRAKYETSGEGMNLFATLELRPNHNLDQPEAMHIGFRNSMCKHFSLGIVAGHKVLVCSNLCFYGDWSVARRHTSGLDEGELGSFSNRAVIRALIGMAEHRQWFQELNNYIVPVDERKKLLYDAVEADVFAAASWSRGMASHAEEMATNRNPAGEALSHFHGAVTRSLRESSLNQQQIRTLRLNRLCQKYIDTAFM